MTCLPGDFDTLLDFAKARPNPPASGLRYGTIAR